MEKSHVSSTRFPSMVVSCKTVVQHHNQDVNIDAINIRNISFTTRMMTFYSYNHFPPTFTTSLNPSNQYSLLHFYNFIISRMLYKWNHMVYNLLRLPFSTQHNLLEIYLGCFVSRQFVRFICRVIFYGAGILTFEGHLHCFLFLAVANEAAINVCV